MTVTHSPLRKLLIEVIGNIRFGRKPKVFGIGFNKTGTTSLKAALESMGYVVAFQETAEHTLLDCVNGNYQPLIRYCKYGGNAFQDIPFSIPNTYKVLDKEFPNSKFVLTVRDSPAQWYRSITEFHSKRFGNGEIPTKETLLDSDYLYRGYPYISIKAIFNTPDNDLYNQEALIKCYKNHIKDVEDYFSNRPDDILVINPSDPYAMAKLGDFLGQSAKTAAFPKRNTTESYK